jgi:hypothetical protein
VVRLPGRRSLNLNLNLVAIRLRCIIAVHMLPSSCTISRTLPAFKLCEAGLKVRPRLLVPITTDSRISAEPRHYNPL